MQAPADIVTRFYAAIASGEHGEALSPYLDDDARTVEHPNALVPSGRTSDRAAMLAASSAGASLLARQTYEIRDLVEFGDLVVARLVWRGVVAADAGPFTAGQELTAQIAQFVRVDDGRIVEIETYDCYEPLPAENVPAA